MCGDADILSASSTIERLTSMSRINIYMPEDKQDADEIAPEYDELEELEEEEI